MRADYFVYIGNAYPHKNLSRLIDAIILVNTKLIIVSGRSIFIERLQKEINRKNASKLVEVLGFVTDKDLKNLYKNSIAFVFPTLSEGFGLPPKEAIEAGTLAVISDIPVLKEVYEDSVLYFDPLDVNSIADALLKVVNIKEDERKIKILKSQQFVKKYSWSKMAKETLKIYESTK
ncbi:MAG: glycosyltransferase family 1 protein [Candidatus Woesearchaeota archaeon]|jgi:glycosyltransferase involved in cell wall biosynthesis